jgi:predicted permease
LALIRSIPGIEDAAVASDLPLLNLGGGAGVLGEGKLQPQSAFSAPYAQWTSVSPGYFRTLRIPVLQGRDFDDRDRQDTASVAVVNQAFVRQFLHGGAALGNRIALAADPSRYRQIVGVVGDVRQLGIEKQTVPQVFFSINQLEHNWLAIVVRAQGDAMQYVTPIREAVRKADDQIAVFLPRTMEQIIVQQRGWRIFETSVVAAFAAVAILLAALGTYAVISYSIAQRIAEVGIRVALGATDRDILTAFTLQGAIPAVAGAALGIVLGFWAARVSARLFYEIGPNDLASYAVSLFTVVVAAVAASYFPARRAALMDPSRTLRYE